MAIFALSDLHLPLGINKPMNVFGERWDNYVEKIEYEWKKNITEDDFVIINGDFSWAMYLEESLKDFEFLSKLPGKKLISKGNHDYWWETLKKMNEFLNENNLSDIFFIHNNAILCDGVSVCAAKGWITPSDKNFKSEDLKLYHRELIRFENSLKEAKLLSERIVAALHFPPDDAFISLAEKYGAEKIIFGHLHGKKAEEYRKTDEKCLLVSADFLKFTPLRII